MEKFDLFCSITANCFRDNVNLPDCGMSLVPALLQERGATPNEIRQAILNSPYKAMKMQWSGDLESLFSLF